MTGPTVWFDDADLDRDRWRDLVAPVVERVVQAAAADRLAHALLLVGPQAMGRELAAIEIAALLTCPQGTGPWCECGSCRRARAGIHPDVMGVFPGRDSRTGKVKKFITIDLVREIVDSARTRPYEGARRVWIFADAEQASGLGPNAGNAFLKTLEEPPAHCVFLLLAANPDAVLPTVRSRCQRLGLPGAVAIARAGDPEVETPELAALADGAAETVTAVRTALTEAAAGEVLALLRLARALSGEDSAFEIAAAACLAHAGATTDAEAAEDLALLAGDLLVVGRRSRVLNLTAERQLLGCLLDWHRGRAGSG